jgi:hypothetical protein
VNHKTNLPAFPVMRELFAGESEALIQGDAVPALFVRSLGNFLGSQIRLYEGGSECMDWTGFCNWLRIETGSNEGTHYIHGRIAAGGTQGEFDGRRFRADTQPSCSKPSPGLWPAAFDNMYLA